MNIPEEKHFWMTYNKHNCGRYYNHPQKMGGYGMDARVADWISELVGYKVSRQRGWEYLKEMKLRLRVPRPSHQETDYFEQEEWKKKLTSEVAQVQKKHPGADVEVWTMDELANWA